MCPRESYHCEVQLKELEASTPDSSPGGWGPPRPGRGGGYRQTGLGHTQELPGESLQ